MDIITLSIPSSSYSCFLTAWRQKQFAGQRFGQAFCNYFKLPLCSSHKELEMKLWNMERSEAEPLIRTILDYQQ